MKKRDSLRTDTITSWPSIGHESAVVYRCTFFKTFTAVSEHGQTVFISGTRRWNVNRRKTDVRKSPRKKYALTRSHRQWPIKTDFVVVDGFNTEIVSILTTRFYTRKPIEKYPEPSLYSHKTMSQNFPRLWPFKTLHHHGSSVRLDRQNRSQPGSGCVSM